MPYSKCPNCNQLFHLLVSKDLEQWYKENAPGKKIGDEVNLQCFGCWKELKEYEVVRVISLRGMESDSSVEHEDVGTILMILDSTDKIAYEVECVLPDGSTKWIETFKRNQLRYEPHLNKNKTEQGDSA